MSPQQTSNAPDARSADESDDTTPAHIPADSHTDQNPGGDTLLGAADDAGSAGGRGTVPDAPFTVTVGGKAHPPWTASQRPNRHARAIDRR